MMKAAARARKLPEMRPRFPTETPIDGFGAIRRVLHSDTSCELYLLNRRGLTTILMIALAQPLLAESPTYDQLEAFLAASEVEVVGSFSPGGRKAGIIVRIHGHWLGEAMERDYTLDELYQLLFALIDLAQMQGDGLRASIRRRHLWLGGPRWAPKLIPVCGADLANASKTPAREIAELFVWLATGLDVHGLSSDLDEKRFRDWCEVADGHIARLVMLWLNSNKKAPRLLQLRREVELAMLRSGATRPS